LPSRRETKKNCIASLLKGIRRGGAREAGRRRRDEAGREEVPLAAARRAGEQRPAMVAAPRAGPSRTRS